MVMEASPTAVLFRVQNLAIPLPSLSPGFLLSNPLFLKPVFACVGAGGTAPDPLLWRKAGGCVTDCLGQRPCWPRAGGWGLGQNRGPPGVLPPVPQLEGWRSFFTCPGLCVPSNGLWRGALLACCVGHWGAFPGCQLMIFLGKSIILMASSPPFFPKS